MWAKGKTICVHCYHDHFHLVTGVHEFMLTIEAYDLCCLKFVKPRSIDKIDEKKCTFLVVVLCVAESTNMYSGNARPYQIGKRPRGLYDNIITIHIFSVNYKKQSVQFNVSDPIQACSKTKRADIRIMAD